MKKMIMCFLVLTLSLGILGGCGNKTTQTGDSSEQKAAADKPQEVKFVEENGILTCTDVYNSPFEDSGLKTLIKKGEGSYVKFIKTDLEGSETDEYYNFDYANNIAEKYYISSRGGFYLYYDLENSTLLKVEDKNHNDMTQKIKDSGKLDQFTNSISGDVEVLEKYFEELYGMTIKEAVSGE